MSGFNARYCLTEENRPPVDQRAAARELALSAPTTTAAIPVALALDVMAIKRWRGEFNAAIDSLVAGDEAERGRMLTALSRIERLASHGRKLLEPKR
jgi:hypothetical protein